MRKRKLLVALLLFLEFRAHTDTYVVHSPGGSAESTAAESNSGIQVGIGYRFR